MQPYDFQYRTPGHNISARVPGHDGRGRALAGLIEGVSDGLSAFATMGSGPYTDKWRRRKPVLFVGYSFTALGAASFGLATAAWHVLLARACAWLGRGVRTPVRKALLAGAVTKDTYAPTRRG